MVVLEDLVEQQVDIVRPVVLEPLDKEEMEEELVVTLVVAVVVQVKYQDLMV
tara:strand:- start:98 stop:253 length:156 start_codon:yes stop_codon:yes gene_type:complete